MARTKILGTFLDLSSTDNIKVVGAAGSSGTIEICDVDNGSASADSLTLTKSGFHSFIYNRDTDGYLAIGAGGSHAHIRITNAGKVGIGETSPRHKLSVNGTLGSSTFDGFGLGVVGGIATAESGTTNAAMGLQCTSASTSKLFAYDYAGSAGIPISIQPDNANVFICAGGGNVGIGDTTPLTKLEVAGSIKATNRSTGHTGEAGVTLSYNTSSSIALLETWQSKPLVIDTFNYQQFNIGNSEAMKIDGTTRNVTIGAGTVFENERLNIKKTGNNDDAVLALDHDTGDASFYRFVRFYKKNANESLGKIDYDASGDAMTLAVESDERYKTITGPADGMNLISKLNPIKYTRPTKGVTDGCGFGAQSYKQAFDDIGAYPRGVTVGSDTEKWMLDFAPLVPNLVKALQEQQALIDALEARIEALESE